MLGGSLDRRGVWGRMDTCICMAESLYCSPETIARLLISYMLIQKKKKKFRKKLPKKKLNTNGDPDDKESAYNVGNPSSIFVSGRSPGQGNGYALQYSWL